MALPNPAAGQPAEGPEAQKSSSVDQSEDGLQTVTFGSGCFWCTEAVFDALKGVKSAESGYSGGVVPNPTYEQVCTGMTGHAEVVQVIYDPKTISFAQLLEVFWQTHDPTTLDQQGPDHGTQYRSAIFYHNEDQRREAEHYLRKLDESGAFDAPIVTEITAFETFFSAEDYHQEYYAENPRTQYCRAVISPKMRKFRKAFKDLLKTKEELREEAPEQGAEVKEPAENPAETAARKTATANDPDAPGIDPEKIDWSKVDWRNRLNRKEFAILRLADTERAFTGEYWDFFEDGAYKCRGCGLPLFESDSKFDSECGWPSFDRPINDKAVVAVEDNSHGMHRIEIRCRRCNGHLGHVFNDGPTETGIRFCMNSASIKFVPAEEEEKAAAEAAKATAKDQKTKPAATSAADKEK